MSTDFVVRIGYDEIEPEDISLLRQTLNLTDPAVEAVYQLHRRWGKDWMQKTLDMPDSDETDRVSAGNEYSRKYFSESKPWIGHHPQTAFHCCSRSMNAVDSILEYLERGINVVLEFGRYRDITAYMLVANMLASRIYKRYQEKTEASMAGKVHSADPAGHYH